jgi:iron(III) transport system ATP-binding protein
MQQVGTPAEIYRNPANRFVAEFIGKTNILERTIQRRDGAATLELGDGVMIDVTRQIAPDVQGPVQVSVRPEAVRAGAHGLAAEVADETFLGSHSQVRARLDTGETVEFLEFSHRAEPWPRGTRIALEVDPQMLTFFDAATGNSIMHRVGA